MRKIKTKAELKALGDPYPQTSGAANKLFEHRSIFSCDICGQDFNKEEKLTNHEINHMKLVDFVIR